MSIAEAQAETEYLKNSGTLKSDEGRERLIIYGLSLPAVLAILIVVFLPIFWLSSLSLFNATGALSAQN